MERYRLQMAPRKYLKFEFPAKNFQKSVMWKIIFFSVFISKFGRSHFSFPNSEPRRVLNGKLWPPTWSHRCQDQMLLEGLCMESSFSCFLFEIKNFSPLSKAYKERCHITKFREIQNISLRNDHQMSPKLFDRSFHYLSSRQHWYIQNNRQWQWGTLYSALTALGL